MEKFRHLRIKDLEALASSGSGYRGSPMKEAFAKSKLPPEAPISHFAHDEEVAALVRMVEADPALAEKAVKAEKLRKDMDYAENGIVELMRGKATKALLIGVACAGAIAVTVHFLREDLRNITIALEIGFALVSASILDKSPRGLNQALQKKMDDAEAGLKKLYWGS